MHHMYTSIHTHTLIEYPIDLTCFWEIGGKQRTWRKSIMEEHGDPPWPCFLNEFMNEWLTNACNDCAILLSVPFRCHTLKTCLMHVPCFPLCLGRFNQLLKENNITLPQVSAIPKLPSRLSQITHQLPPLPTRLSQLPQRVIQITQRIPKHFPSFPWKPNILERFSCRFPHGLPNRPQTLSDFSQHFSNFPQSLSNIPNYLSNLPQHFSSVPRQCYTTVQKHLSSIRPQNNA